MENATDKAETAGAPDGAEVGLDTRVDADAVAPARRRPGWRTVAIVLLCVALLGVASVAAWLVVTMLDLRDTLVEQEEQIRQQQDEIDELNDLLDEKQEFAAAMTEFLREAREFGGVPFAAVVPFDDAEALAHHAWMSRRVGVAVDADTASVRELTEEMRQARAAADAELASNATGTLYEAILDEIGAGFARLSLGGADEVCRDDVLGCVSGEDAYLVHLDGGDLAQPWMDDWSRRFITLHEFAHVLQFTNTAATAAAEGAFGGDHEFMADCYALREMNEWTLSRRVWVSSFEYWDTELGYGRVCDAAQRTVIAEWLGQVGVPVRTVSQ